MRDFLPEDVRRREYVIGVVRHVYERYGFEPLETPAVENLETLQGKYGDEGNKLIFKILKRGEHEATGQADLALRYDLTVPLARVVAHHQAKLPRLFKRYQIQPVWRADRPARGRFREFYQCDVDSLGSTSPVIEAELCAAVSDVLVELGFTEFVIRINHRQLLTHWLNSAGIPAGSQADALVALDKRDKIGVDGVEKELQQQGVSQAAIDWLLRSFSEKVDDLIKAAGAETSHAALGAVEAVVKSDPVSDAPGHFGRTNLSEILELCTHTSAAARVRWDPFLARGLSYYTGAIMEVAVADLAGSLGGGGRYDNLVGMFSGQPVPACGFSLGLERILVVMAERHMFPASVGERYADVMVTIWNESSKADALALASEIRKAGLRVDVYPEADKLGKQFKYAASRHVPLVTVVGDDERAAATVTIKDLRSGRQDAIPRAEAGTQVRQALERTP
ncbi:MAG: histidine--tRNA ligase [Acidobacteria bacterium]|nr:histidine--tRNA ligase [Acidobacteriota bacterium]